jgi:hypothetical protein
MEKIPPEAHFGTRTYVRRKMAQGYSLVAGQHGFPDASVALDWLMHKGLVVESGEPEGGLLHWGHSEGDFSIVELTSVGARQQTVWEIPEKEKATDGWFRELKGGRLEAMVKSPETRLRVSGTPDQVWEAVEMFERWTGIEVNGEWRRPLRRGPRPMAGQQSLLVDKRVSDGEEPDALSNS